MPPAGFEPRISAGERPQINALDRASTGTGSVRDNVGKYCTAGQATNDNIMWLGKDVMWLPHG